MQKKVLALHDLSGFGRLSLVPIIAAISAAGHQCVPLPTAYFSTHMAIPGWETIDLTGVMPRVIDQYDRLGLRFESVYAGFLGSAPPHTAAEVQRRDPRLLSVPQRRQRNICRICHPISPLSIISAYRLCTFAKFGATLPCLHI